jgi:hypothetical protein
MGLKISYYPEDIDDCILVSIGNTPETNIIADTRNSRPR